MYDKLHFVIRGYKKFLVPLLFLPNYCKKYYFLAYADENFLFWCYEVKLYVFFFQRPYRCPVSNYLRALLVSFYFHAKFVMKFSVSALQEAPFGLLSCHGVLSLVEPSFLNMCGSRGIMLYSWPYKRIVKLPRSITIWLQLLVAS